MYFNLFSMKRSLNNGMKFILIEGILIMNFVYDRMKIRVMVISWYYNIPRSIISPVLAISLSSSSYIIKDNQIDLNVQRCRGVIRCLIKIADLT